MQITCPNCAAVYEVDDAVLSNGGRQVRCTNCGQTWQQMPKDAERGETAYRQTGSEQLQNVADPQLTRSRPSPEVLEVLREEADRETRARREEAKAASAADSRRIETGRETSAHMSDEDDGRTSQRDESDGYMAPTRTRPAGMLISGLMILSALGVVVVYSYAPQIADAIPQARPQLIAFVERANELRALINGLMETLIDAVP